MDKAKRIQRLVSLRILTVFPFHLPYPYGTGDTLCASINLSTIIKHFFCKCNIKKQIILSVCDCKILFVTVLTTNFSISAISENKLFCSHNIAYDNIVQSVFPVDIYRLIVLAFCYDICYRRICQITRNAYRVPVFRTDNI